MGVSSYNVWPGKLICLFLVGRFFQHHFRLAMGLQSILFISTIAGCGIYRRPLDVWSALGFIAIFDSAVYAMRVSIREG